MATRPPQVGADEVATVTVRLSQVPRELRQQAADVLVKNAGLTTFAALELALAAAEPIQDPELVVPAAKARLVLEKGKFPTGKFPVFE